MTNIVMYKPNGDTLAVRIPDNVGTMLVIRSSTPRPLENRLHRISLSTAHQLWDHRIVDKDGTMVLREPLRKAQLSFQEIATRMRERAEQDIEPRGSLASIIDADSSVDFWHRVLNHLRSAAKRYRLRVFRKPWTKRLSVAEIQNQRTEKDEGIGFDTSSINPFSNADFVPWLGITEALCPSLTDQSAVAPPLPNRSVKYAKAREGVYWRLVLPSATTTTTNIDLAPLTSSDKPDEPDSDRSDVDPALVEAKLQELINPLILYRLHLPDQYEDIETNEKLWDQFIRDSAKRNQTRFKNPEITNATFCNLRRVSIQHETPFMISAASLQKFALIQMNSTELQVVCNVELPEDPPTRPFKHWGIHHAQDHPGQDHVCQFCDRTFSRKRWPITHKHCDKKVKEKWIFTCLLCSAEFKNNVPGIERGLHRHLAEEHTDPVRRIKCDKDFKHMMHWCLHTSAIEVSNMARTVDVENQ
ncbi:hypothetical protein B0J13DRAFT_665749 [Dactylonectria estremocensis]|uniref:Uncharacterized protein n=1 Tax=Dactylonectria estremocensis TaxID=1079267 RepID=A0A9P9J7N5_9HYPO|nr:hypothetical protein B0J13DRAFT_665749 [Dactylonectria estremocensis]